MANELFNDGEADPRAAPKTCQRTQRTDSKGENLLASGNKNDLPTQVWDIGLWIEPS